MTLVAREPRSPAKLHEVEHHLYADDTQASDHIQLSQATAAIANIERCVVSVHSWCSSKRLQLNPTKTEIIWFGSRTSLRRLQGVDLSLHVGADTIVPLAVVRDLGVLLDSELKMTNHISKVTSVCFFHLRRLKQARRVLGEAITTRLVLSFVVSRLDYCNAVLAGLPLSTIAPLQRVQNAAVRIIKRLGPRDHITAARRELLWLPIKFRITYKLCILMHMVHIGSCPSYLSEMVQATSSLSGRSRLRYEIPATHHKIGERAFSYAGPAAWNSSPATITDLTDTKLFKISLKTHLFQLAYDDE